MVKIDKTNGIKVKTAKKEIDNNFTFSPNIPASRRLRVVGGVILKLQPNGVYRLKSEGTYLSFTPESLWNAACVTGINPENNTRRKRA